MTNWRTTTLGVLGLIIALGTALRAMLDGDPGTVADWNTVGMVLLPVIGCILGRDPDWLIRLLGGASTQAAIKR